MPESAETSVSIAGVPASPDAAPRPLRAGFRSVVLVCGACAERSKGPKKLKAKALAGELRRACRERGVPRPRIVVTSCLGACPKKAYTVAAASGSGPLALIAFRRGDDAAAAVDLLFPTPAAAPHASASAPASTSNSTSSTPSPT